MCLPSTTTSRSSARSAPASRGAATTCARRRTAKPHWISFATRRWTSFCSIDGHEVIRQARAWRDVPIIVLTVRDSQEHKVAALDAGADDYVTKPFAIEELLARIRAVGRRASGETPRAVLRFGELEIDLTREAVKLRGELLHLTPTEYRLLEAMATHPGKLLTHSWLLQQVWGPRYADESHYVRVYVRQLRRKLGDDPAAPRYIVTESGLGYRWKPEPEDPE
jgi:two-component system, OmpR family, KDP operon response regulator KdpE